MIDTLLQLCPGNLAAQINNLNSSIKANWKEAIGYLGNMDIVSKNK